MSLSYRRRLIALQRANVSVPELHESVIAWLRRTALSRSARDLDEVQLIYRLARLQWLKAETRYPPESRRYHAIRRRIFAGTRMELLSMHLPWHEADAIAADAVGQYRTTRSQPLSRCAARD